MRLAGHLRLGSASALAALLGFAFGWHLMILSSVECRVRCVGTKVAIRRHPGKSSRTHEGKGGKVEAQARSRGVSELASKCFYATFTHTLRNS